MNLSLLSRFRLHHCWRHGLAIAVGVLALLATTRLAGAARPPDIVIYIVDDLGPEFTGYHGNAAIRTPRLDALAREGLQFHRAFAASPTCSPARAAMLTGRWPQNNGTMGNHTDARPGLVSIAQRLRPLGYRVVAMNKTDVRPASVFNWEWIRAALPTDQKFRRYRGEGLDTRAVEQLLAAHRREHPDQPLCLMLGENSPHVVWERNHSYDPGALPLTPLLVDTPKTRAALANYYQDITTMDTRLGQVLDSLDRYGYSDHTMFIFTSDQGPEWPRCKWTLYDSGLRVPFIVRWPGVAPRGRQTNALISHIDIIPTLLAAAGAAPGADLDGASFLEVLRGTSDRGRTEIFASHTGDGEMNQTPTRAVRDERFKFILNLHPEREWTTHFTKVHGITDSHAEVWDTWLARAASDPATAALLDRMRFHPAEELYDTAADPWELHNLASDPAHRATLERLRARLAAWRAEVKDTKD